MKFFMMLFLLAFSQSVFANKCVDLVQKEKFYEAEDVCKSSAKKGDSNSQFALGVMYYQGNGMMSDMAIAQKWILKAAKQNHSQAQYNIGIMLASGHGSAPNLVEAYAWLKISAENKYPAAADSVKQLGDELSSSEKKEAEERIKELKAKIKR